MSRTRGGFGRIAVLGTALALALLLLGAREAQAGKYTVAQCGWYVGADAGWADTTGGAKFRPDAWCVPPAGHDPFGGVHVKSLTRSDGTVSGTRFARWRWDAPPGTGITQVRGTWWHALHDGFEQRFGAVTWGGGFDVFAAAAGTNTAPREFVAGFNPPQPALEDRLLCARAESKWCSLSPGSWSALRALTITIQDDHAPAPHIGGELTWAGWRRGVQTVNFWAGDVGSGNRFGETWIDTARVNVTEYPCSLASIGGEWRATRMRPCLTGVSGAAAVDTVRFGDGPHSLSHCGIDFADNTGCTAAQTIYIDNNPPAHPRKLTLVGGEAWRKTNDVDAIWTNPDQGAASSIGGASWRIEGSAGFDTGVRFAAGRDRSSIENLSVPRPGAYSLTVWLRDEAGNEAAGSAVDVPLRFDDVPPAVAFEATAGAEEESDLPAAIRAEVDDVLSGPAGGAIFMRRIDAESWDELPTKFVAGTAPGSASLVAPLPDDLGAGTYLFRADATDRAGNLATTTRRVDGTQMAVRKRVAVAPARQVAPPKTKTRLFARLRWRQRTAGAALTVPFGAITVLSGRLLDADGAGLAARNLRIVSRPSRGALVGWAVHTATTGEHGGFRLELPGGPSRRITVAYPGDASWEPARRPGLALRVRSGVSLSVAPRTLRTGEVLRIRGRVRTLGAPLPRRGKLVAIQYYETAARRWRPVLLTRSGHSGRFKAQYRFRYVNGTARIRLRAVVLPEERWPYVPGASRPVVVRVTG